MPSGNCATCRGGGAASGIETGLRGPSLHASRWPFGVACHSRVMPRSRRMPSARSRRVLRTRREASSRTLPSAPSRSARCSAEVPGGGMSSKGFKSLSASPAMRHLLVFATDYPPSNCTPSDPRGGIRAASPGPEGAAGRVSAVTWAGRSRCSRTVRKGGRGVPGARKIPSFQRFAGQQDDSAPLPRIRASATPDSEARFRGNA